LKKLSPGFEQIRLAVMFVNKRRRWSRNACSITETPVPVIEVS
jgi:hypothetical protein